MSEVSMTSSGREGFLPEAWVSFEGAVTVSDNGGIELASRLASRYRDLSDPRNRKELDSWERDLEAFCLFRLTPDHIR